MKKLLLVACSAAGLALCGCSTDQPVFQSEASAQKAVNGTNGDPDAPQADAQEANRDIINQQNMGGTGGTGGGPTNPNMGRIQQQEGGGGYGH